MNIKSVLFGSAAALAFATAGHAADAIVAAEPEAVEYVRICDAYGTGYFYIPGTETCLKIGGQVRTEGLFYNPYNSRASSAGTVWHSRAELSLDTATDTEYGPLRTNTVYRFDFDNADGANTQKLLFANISLGGFLVGKLDSQFEYYVGYAGDVINDDVISDGPDELNQLTYTYDAGNGFTAVLSLEDQAGSSTGETTRFRNTGVADNHHWAPDVVAGAGYKWGGFGLKVVGGYDSAVEEGAIKARFDADFGAFSAFLMGGWNTDGKKLNKYAASNFDYDPATNLSSACPVDRQYLCGWGDWALWGGGSYTFNDKLKSSFQLAYTDSKIFEATANVQFHPVKDLLVEPEVTYVNWDSINKDQWSGTLRFERKF